MFTGLVEGMGRVVELIDEPAGLRLRMAAPEAILDIESEVRIGDSIAINGCCLTIVAATDGVWDFQAGAETLSRTNLGRLKAGANVNLERSLRLGDRLGGHIVQGHVDGTAEVARVDEDDAWTTMWFRAIPALTLQMVSKGSVAVDGVSLTLVDVTQETFSIALIPHTLQVTTLGERRVGDVVNIETDLLAKYVQKLMERASPPLA